MPDRQGWYTFLWGPVPVTVATVVLAAAGTISSDEPMLFLVLPSAVFIVLHAVVRANKDKSMIRRLGRHYDHVQRRSVQVVSDLGRLTGNRFDLWMVDLYLPVTHATVAWRWPFLIRQQELSRQISVSLVDTRPQEPSLDSQVGPHGRCFTSGKPLIWFDETDLRHSDNVLQPPVENLWRSLHPAENEELSKVFGVLSVSPLVDQLGKNCVGVLAVHVAPERATALHAHGALRSVEGRQRITNACVELNRLLAR